MNKIISKDIVIDYDVKLCDHNNWSDWTIVSYNPFYEEGGNQSHLVEHACITCGIRQLADCYKEKNIVLNSVYRIFKTLYRSEFDNAKN